MAVMWQLDLKVSTQRVKEDGMLSLCFYYTDGILHVWNTKTQALEKAVQEHRQVMRRYEIVRYVLIRILYSGIICGVSWNPSGECLYTADKKKTICMWDTALH